MNLFGKKQTQAAIFWQYHNYICKWFKKKRERKMKRRVYCF